MLRKLTIELDKVVIGSDLNAAQFAYENKASFIRNCDPSIFVFDSFQNSTSFAGVEYHSKIEYWDHLVWDLAMRGFCPFGDIVKNIRLDSDGLTVATKNERVVKVSFNKCYVFDLTNTTHFPFEGCEVVERLRVFDWLYVNGIRNTDKNVIEVDDEHVITLHLYRDKRKGGVVVEGTIEERQREEFEVSPMMSKMKALYYLKQEGLHFPTRRMKMDFLKRDYLPVKNTIYKEVGNIIYKGLNYEMGKTK